MSFVQKWILTSCILLGFFYVLSALCLIIREIPLHPEAFFSKKYQERRLRNFLGGIVIFFLLSILLGAIIATAWTGAESLAGVALQVTPLFYFVNFLIFFSISLFTSSILGLPSTSINIPFSRKCSITGIVSSLKT